MQYYNSMAAVYLRSQNLIFYVIFTRNLWEILLLFTGFTTEKRHLYVFKLLVKLKKPKIFYKFKINEHWTRINESNYE